MSSENEYKIAIVGPQAATASFYALGFDQIAVDTPAEAREQILDLRAQTNAAGRPRYAIIYVLEDLATAITDDDWKKWSRAALPAITLIPSGLSGLGLGAARMKKIVERAVGSDILG